MVFHRGVGLSEPEAYGPEAVSLVTRKRDPAGRDRRAVKMNCLIRNGNYENAHLGCEVLQEGNRRDHISSNQGIPQRRNKRRIRKLIAFSLQPKQPEQLPWFIKFLMTATFYEAINV